MRLGHCRFIVFEFGVFGLAAAKVWWSQFNKLKTKLSSIKRVALRELRLKIGYSVLLNDGGAKNVLIVIESPRAFFSRSILWQNNSHSGAADCDKTAVGPQTDCFWLSYYKNILLCVTIRYLIINKLLLKIIYIYVHNEIDLISDFFPINVCNIYLKKCCIILLYIIWSSNTIFSVIKNVLFGDGLIRK